MELRRQILDALYAGQPFRATLRDLGLTPNQVWGLTRTDDAWRVALDAALTAMRRDDLEHGTNAAYVTGCVCGIAGSTSGGGWAGVNFAPRTASPPGSRPSMALLVYGLASAATPLPRVRREYTNSREFDLMTAVAQSGNRYLDRPAPSSLADVIDTILDKGLVIDI